MPITDNSQLDDQPVLDADNAFLGGQVSAADESNIPKGAYAEAQNMDFDQFGRLQTRRGARTTTGNAEARNWEDIATNWNALTSYWGTTLSSTAIDAAFYYDTYAAEYMIIAQGGALLQGTESSIYAAIASASYAGSTVYFGQLNNRLYYCDGSGALKYIDSTLTHNAITAGKVSSIKITVPGIGYTSVPAITFSSGAAAATAVLGYGGKVVSATVTTPSSGYSATTPPTISFAAAPAGGTTAEGVVNLSQLPSKPAFLVSHKNRLFCTSADTSIPPDTVYASDILDGESWDLVGASVRVGGDGDPITALYPWFGNNLVVFKQRSIWVIDADPLINPADWEITLINNRIGCVAHRSIQAVGADVYFLAQDGVRSLAQIQAGTQTEVGQTLSAPIQDEIDTINQSVMTTICSAFYRNRYFLAIPTGSNTTPNRVLVWNELSKSWLGGWTGWSPRDFVVSGFSGRIRLNFADNAGKLWTWDDYTILADETVSQYRDDTTPYESFVITRAYSHGEPLVNKLGHSVHLFTENNLTDGSQTNYLYYDKDLSGTFTALDTAITVTSGDKFHRVVKNLISKGRFNVIQFKAGASTGKFTLSGIASTALPDTLQMEVSG
jgi:hypothetical protein